jgi:hypothetical protein
MSLKQMLTVWDYDLKHGEQAVLLAMADHANEDGTGMWPSNALLAYKTGYSERSVKRIKAQLREKGVLVIVRRASRHRPTEYRFDWSKARPKPPFGGPVDNSNEGGQDDTPKAPRGDTSDTEGCQERQLGVTVVSPEPSRTNNRTSSKQRGCARGSDAVPLGAVVASRLDAAAADLKNGMLARARAVEAQASVVLDRDPAGRTVSALDLLVERGVEGTMPRRLVEDCGDEAVLAAVREWDARRAAGRKVGTGLLVTLCRDGVGGGVTTAALISYAAMLDVCEREGIPTDAFEAVAVTGEAKPLWRRKPGKPDHRKGRAAGGPA